MSDSENTATEVIAEVQEKAAEVQAVVDEAAEGGDVLINGPARIRLVMALDHVETAEDAVNMFITDILYHGLRDYVFLVEDVDGGVVYGVNGDGQSVDLDEDAIPSQ